MKKYLLILIAALAFATSANAAEEKSAASSGSEFMGMSLDINTMPEWNLLFKLNPQLTLAGILGFELYNDDNDDNDHFDFTFGIGAAFEVTKMLLPISLEVDLKYSTADWLSLDFLMDLSLQVLPHFNLVGKGGLDIKYVTSGSSPLTISPVTKISAVWFFL